jgi:hypothetical protein
MDCKTIKVKGVLWKISLIAQENEVGYTQLRATNIDHVAK